MEAAVELYKTRIDPMNEGKHTFIFRLHFSNGGNFMEPCEKEESALTFDELFAKMLLAVDSAFLTRMQRAPHSGATLSEESAGHPPLLLREPKDMKLAVTRCVQITEDGFKSIKILDVRVRESSQELPVYNGTKPFASEPEIVFNTSIFDLPKEVLMGTLQRLNLIEQQNLRDIIPSWEEILSDPYLQRKVVLCREGLSENLAWLGLLGPLTEYITYKADGCHKQDIERDDREFRFLFEVVIPKCPRLKELTIINMKGVLQPCLLLRLPSCVERLTLINVDVTLTLLRHWKPYHGTSYAGPATTAVFVNTTIEWGARKKINLAAAIDEVLDKFIHQEPYTLRWIAAGIAYAVEKSDYDDLDTAATIIRRNEKRLKNFEEDDLLTLDLTTLRALTLCDLCGMIMNCLDNNDHSGDNYSVHLENYAHQVPSNSHLLFL